MESVCTCKRTVGSNPTPSARTLADSLNYSRNFFGGVFGPRRGPHSIPAHNVAPMRVWLACGRDRMGFLARISRYQAARANRHRNESARRDGIEGFGSGGAWHQAHRTGSGRNYRERAWLRYRRLSCPSTSPEPRGPCSQQRFLIAFGRVPRTACDAWAGGRNQTDGAGRRKGSTSFLKKKKQKTS